MANVLKDIGRANITALLAASTYKYLGWGTGAGTAVVGSPNTLFTESSETRVAGTQSQVTTSVTNDTYQVQGTLTATGSRAILNAAVCASVTNGTADAFLHSDFSVVNLNTSDAIQFTFKLQFT